MQLIKRLLPLIAATAFTSAQGADLYWNAGDGSDASGTWDIGTTANWNTASDGTGSASSFTDSDSVIFSATSVANSGTITVSGAPTATDLTILENGNYTFDGDLGLGTAATYTVSSGATATFNDIVTVNDNSTFNIEGNSTMNLNGRGKTITKTGSGTLTLTDANSSDYAINANEGLIVVARTTTKQLKTVNIGASGTLQLSTSDQLNPLTVDGTFIMDDGISDSLGQLY
ncbi:MAG: hypothetical protein ACQKBT_09815, partial [Puniceicoccales bacterium]